MLHFGVGGISPGFAHDVLTLLVRDFLPGPSHNSGQNSSGLRRDERHLTNQRQKWFNLERFEHHGFAATRVVPGGKRRQILGVG